ncbi:MAG: hypothetical protein U5L96_07200 [Owenweeksia sp.]|nr:hypothetical protein [Owenweeksia sp.]
MSHRSNCNPSLAQYFFLSGPPSIGSTAFSTTNLNLSYAISPTSDIEDRNVDLTVTSVNPVDDWFFGEYKTTFKVHSDSIYVLWYENCCRIGALANNANDGFRSETVATPCGTGNESPKGTIVPIVKLPKDNAAAGFFIAAADPNGDPLTYRLATNNEAEDDGFASSTNAPGFSVNSNGSATLIPWAPLRVTSIMLG